jgi:hypothetical protein
MLFRLHHNLYASTLFSLSFFGNGSQLQSEGRKKMVFGFFSQIAKFRIGIVHKANMLASLRILCEWLTQWLVCLYFVMHLLAIKFDQ